MATISTYKIKRDKGDYVSNLYTKYNKANVGCFYHETQNPKISKCIILHAISSYK